MLGESADVVEPTVEGEVNPEADRRVDGEVEGAVSSVASVSTEIGEFPSYLCGRTTLSTLTSCFRACIPNV